MSRKNEGKNDQKKLEEKNSNNKLFLLLIEEIKVNLENRIKNEIPIIVYIILQKSIIHQFEKKFLEDYFKKKIN